MERKLSWEVVHAAGVHKTQRVPHRLGAQHTLTGDWTEAAISQGGGHDAGALTRHLDGAQLEDMKQEEVWDLCRWSGKGWKATQEEAIKVVNSRSCWKLHLQEIHHKSCYSTDACYSQNIITVS